MSRSRNATAGRIASRQHGLITRRQALDAGYTTSAIQRCRTSGRWTTVEHGVYLINGAPRTWHTNVLAACLAFGAVASHRTAAVLLKIGGFRPGPVEVTLRRNTKLHRSGSRIHESLDFDLIRPKMIDGIPTTPPARLAVDLGAVIAFERYESAMDQLLGRKDLTWEDMFDTLMSHAKRGRSGVGALRALLEERYGSDVEESPLEQWFLRELQARKLPDPHTQLQVDDRDGSFVARVDVAYLAERIIVELDSLEWHFNRTSFSKDPTTRLRLRRLGWFVLEVTKDMLTDDPDAVFRNLSELLAERSPAAVEHAALDSA